MVTNIKILNGYAMELPNFHKGIEFDFPEGLSVLFGSNGSGKSSILKMIKAYCGIPNGYAGWSRISSELALGAQQKSHFPWVYRAYSPGQSDCIVGWDGTPTFYNEGDVK